MSSNIEVQRICQYCSKEFTARTTTTLFCSHKCSSTAYKAKVRARKVEGSNLETQRIKTQPIEMLKAKEFLSVRDVSILIGCSRQNVYTLINTGKLKATNILEKKTIVKRSDLDKLFEQTEMPQTESNHKPIHYDILDCYNLTEVQDKYRISESALQQFIKRHSIPKIKKGRFAYVPKKEIENYFNIYNSKIQ
ncbi:MAG: helix-turn-helix domain-containing protein [Bacteroidia bacterium]|nr:helix-turn-helix domain-containing protein [Bacteroidia bacterium]